MNYRVGVLGAKGRMGAEVVKAVSAANDMTMVAAIDAGDPVFSMANEGANIVVDFTNPDAAVVHIPWLIENGLHVVVGTTGFTPEQMATFEKVSAAHPQVGILFAPNFSIGAILTMRFAAEAAKFFESAEIIELHHPNKIDAPSGTSIHTAEGIAKSRAEVGKGDMPDATKTGIEGARGARVHGVPIHSVRMPGLVAHEEVLFGDTGEMLTIRHDSFERSSFMPGVLAGIRGVVNNPGITHGLDKFLGLS
jgi:4-hydroxy-tetrahydrodipicolinate reductase